MGKKLIFTRMLAFIFVITFIGSGLIVDKVKAVTNLPNSSIKFTRLEDDYMYQTKTYADYTVIYSEQGYSLNRKGQAVIYREYPYSYDSIIMGRFGNDLYFADGNTGEISSINIETGKTTVISDKAKPYITEYKYITMGSIDKGGNMWFAISDWNEDSCSIINISPSGNVNYSKLFDNAYISRFEVYDGSAYFALTNYDDYSIDKDIYKAKFTNNKLELNTLSTMGYIDQPYYIKFDSKGNLWIVNLESENNWESDELYKFKVTSNGLSYLAKYTNEGQIDLLNIDANDSVWGTRYIANTYNVAIWKLENNSLIDKYIVDTQAVTNDSDYNHLFFSILDDKHMIITVNSFDYSYYSIISDAGWVKDYSGKWYYYNPSNGAPAKGWTSISNKWYYFDSNGAMVTGWIKLNNKWYYLQSNGAMQTGWAQIGGKWYYFGSGGDMKTGWVKSGQYWYYMDTSGAMKTGWIQSGGKWYYLYSDGHMASNTTIDGYKLGSDGAWIQ